jgi:hypothetical protein
MYISSNSRMASQGIAYLLLISQTDADFCLRLDRFYRKRTACYAAAGVVREQAVACLVGSCSLVSASRMGCTGLPRFDTSTNAGGVRETYIARPRNLVFIEAPAAAFAMRCRRSRACTSVGGPFVHGWKFAGCDFLRFVHLAALPEDDLWSAADDSPTAWPNVRGRHQGCKSCLESRLGVPIVLASKNCCPGYQRPCGTLGIALQIMYVCFMQSPLVRRMVL